ncbi:MAG TPA: ATP-binding cassette domain-containing protein, partial [Chloroflexota bacterium]|nr:ATP-binding cassette domain-containing protein [Chloroflexota bacterium]
MAAGQGPAPYWTRVREAAAIGWLGLRLAWQASPRLAAGILLLLALEALLSPLGLVTSRLMVDRAAIDLGVARAQDNLVMLLPLPGWVALAGVALVIGQLIREVMLAFQVMAGERLAVNAGAALIRAINRWPGMTRFEDPEFAADLERARQIPQGSLNLLVGGGRVALAIFRIAGLALALLTLHPLVPGIIILATIPFLPRLWEAQALLGGHRARVTTTLLHQRYIRNQVVHPEPGKDVRLYGLGPFFRRRYDGMYATMAAEMDRVRRRVVLRQTPAMALSLVAVGAVYLYVVWLVATGQRTLGDLALYGGAATMLQFTLLGLSLTLARLPNELAFLPSYFRIVDAPPDLPLPPRGLPAPRSLRHGITFEGVMFAYSGRPQPVLRDLSLHLAPGECVALVGANGAGKTTIIKLLLRLYDPSAGRILLDGVDLRAYDLDALRREVSVVFQDFVRYELTAGENVAVGDLAALGDPARLLAAAQ